MNVIPGEVIIEPAGSRPAPHAQPIGQLAPSGPELDEAQVRAALNNAEANNLDPMSLTLQDLSQAPVVNPNPVQPIPAVVTEVPPKFLKPDGAADVEKIQASTRQLDEEIAKKEAAVLQVQKTVDDYMREYNEKQAKFRNLPNAERTLSQVAPPVPEQIPQGNMTQQQLEEIVRRDFVQDPLVTTARLIDLAIQKRFQPLEEKEKIESTRSNLQALAAKDSRILREDVFSAVNAKLQNDPDLWRLKNPHKAAWLEVKEEMRLGEPPQGVSAQPSRPSPVLGGGTPPSAPSSSVAIPQNVISGLHTLDLRDKKQEAAGDEAVRAMLARERG